VLLNIFVKPIFFRIYLAYTEKTTLVWKQLNCTFTVLKM